MFDVSPDWEQSLLRKQLCLVKSVRSDVTKDNVLRVQSLDRQCERRFSVNNGNSLKHKITLFLHCIFEFLLEKTYYLTLVSQSQSECKAYR